jgi:DNA repair photolyase
MANKKIEMSYSSPRWTAEIADCSLPMTMDTYSNCSFGCAYCFSQFQRGIGDAADAYYHKQVKSINPDNVIKVFTGEKETQFSEWTKARRPVQYGGLSDQFDNFEKKYGVTLDMITKLKQLNYPLSFSTKATWVFHDERYLKLFRGQDNWNVKFSIITLDEEAARKIEVGVPSPRERLEAMKIYSGLNKGGATLRLRPFIVGVSTRDYKDLIIAAHDAGATALSTEFLCLEQRNKNARSNFDKISAVAGFDIYEYYRKFSDHNGYMRLNRKIKEPYIAEMEKLCKKLGMRFYVSDAHFKERCTGACCCGLPDSWNYSRGSFSQALQIAKKEGRVRWADIARDMQHLGFEWGKAQGFNCGSTSSRAKYEYMSMKDYMRYLWNNPKAGQGPCQMFGGILQPEGKDADGNIIYRYDERKSY